MVQDKIPDKNHLSDGRFTDDPFKHLGIPLELETFNLHSADDGINGLWFIENCQIDLIICDINMPRLDVLEALRKNPNNAKLPGFSNRGSGSR